MNRTVIKCSVHWRFVIISFRCTEAREQNACAAEVESHAYDLDTMLFMDWRDAHMQGNKFQQARLLAP